MNKRIIKILALASAFSLAGAGLYYILPYAQSKECILPFKLERDKQEVLDIFIKDRYWLVASEDYSPEFMLENRAPSKNEPRYYGKLDIKVLYNDQNQFIGFIAYYMKNFFVGQILFLDVKEEFRGKGYAQQLMNHAIKDLKSQGATLITLVTRTNNESAQKLYKLLGFNVSYEEHGFIYFDLKP